MLHSFKQKTIEPCTFFNDIEFMKTISRLQDITAAEQGAVLAIGNFDGIHRGHQALLKRAGDIAKKHNKSLAVLTFEPHPRRLFRPDEPPGRLTPPEVKAWRLAKSGVDILFSLTFDWDFASQTAEHFIEYVLQKGINPSHVIVGHDFRFGQMRKGEPSDIQNAGINTTVIDEVSDDAGQGYSSSTARQLLRHGDIDAANEILGWNWEMRGEVVHGDSRGHDLGYPTANTTLGETVHPAYGVYAARVNIDGEKEWHNAAVNIGIRPMFAIPEAQVESYIFDFKRDIYGKTLRVQPVKRLRSEAKFNSLEELKTQIADDCRAALDILKNN